MQKLLALNETLDALSDYYQHLAGGRVWIYGSGCIKHFRTQDVCVCVYFVVSYITDYNYRDHFVYAPSQCETMLHCNVVSHWLGAYTKWSLYVITFVIETHLTW